MSVLALGVIAGAAAAAGGAWRSLERADPGTRAHAAAPRSLVRAVEQNRFAEAESLLRAGVNPNAALTADQRDALLLVAARSDVPVEFVRELLVRGANPDTRDAAGRTALFLALESGNQRCADLLRAAGADPHARSGSGETPASVAAARAAAATPTLVAAR